MLAPRTGLRGLRPRSAQREAEHDQPGEAEAEAAEAQGAPGAVREPVGLGVGLTIAAGVIVFGPVSGASFNPMRSLAPMLVSGEFPAWLAYVAGPLLGGVIGALLYEYLIRPGEPPEPAGAVEEHEAGEATVR